MQLSVDPAAVRALGGLLMAVAVDSTRVSPARVAAELALSREPRVGAAGDEFELNFVRSNERFGDMLYGLGMLLQQSADEYVATEEALAGMTAVASEPGPGPGSGSGGGSW